MAKPAPKSLSQSLTVRASILTVVLYFAARYGWDPEIANAVAVIGASVVAIAMRRGVRDIGASVILCLVLSSCCNHPDYLPTLRIADRALERAESELPTATDQEAYEELRKGRFNAIRRARDAIAKAERRSHE